MNIIPAILPKSQNELNEKVEKILGLVSLVQIDVCDGIFVPSKTEFSSLPFSDKISYELDLMIDVKNSSDLEKYILMRPKSIVLHIESLADPIDCISLVKNSGIKALFSLSNGTPNSFLDPFFEMIDGIQMMGIAEIGSQGNAFDERCLEKISYFKNKFPELPIQIDGSVNFETIKKLSDAGATKFVCGSAVFNGDPKSNIEKLESLVQ